MSGETLTLPTGVRLATDGDRRQEIYSALSRYLGDSWTGSIEFRVVNGHVEHHHELRRFGAPRITEEGPHG